MKEYTGVEHRNEVWWPRDLTEALKQWSAEKMRQLIFKCYLFYDQVILLEKSKILATVPQGDLEYVTNSQLERCELFEIVYLVTNESIAQIPVSLLVSVQHIGCLFKQFTFGFAKIISPFYIKKYFADIRPRECHPRQRCSSQTTRSDSNQQ